MGVVEGHCDPRFAPVRDLFEQSFAGGEELGAAIAFCLDGELVVDLWGGHRDLARTEPWTRDTLVNTYSTTKGMTALCAHRLVERGLLELDAPVARYWPEFAARREGRASRCAGCSRTRRGCRRCGGRSPRRPSTTSTSWPLRSPTRSRGGSPGRAHGYHALTFGFLVGELIRRVAGRSVGRFLRDEVTGPLGADFFIGLPAEEEGRVSDLFGSLAPPAPARAGPRFPGSSASSCAT